MSANIWPDWATYYSATHRGNGNKISGMNAIRDTMQDVFAAISGYASLGPVTKGVVWRGQAKTQWRVASKLGREGTGGATSQEQLQQWVEHEKEMIESVRVVGPEGAHHQGDLEILARLRHHGAATRLIDFTRDPLVALWFCCNEDDTPDTDDHDGVVVAADRQWFREIDKPWKFEYSKISGGKPYLFALPSIDPRITAQRGLFAFAVEPGDPEQNFLSELGNGSWHDWNKVYDKALPKLCDRDVRWSDAVGRPTKNFPQLVGIFVPKEIKPLMRQVLDVTYGLNRTTMYPDFAGLGKAFDHLSATT